MTPDMHPDEWAARQQLAACYRIFAMLGWTEMIYNHITLRLPDSASGDDKQFLINPFGLHYTEITASNLVKVNLAGDIIGSSRYPINPAGYVLHSTIHGGIEGAHAVMHTHTTAGVAVASLASGLSQSNFYSAQLHDLVAHHEFEGITVHMEEGPRVLRSIGRKPAVILKNHGLLSWGTTLPEAFAVLWTLQRACEIQMATLSMGQPLPVPEDIAAKCTRDSLQFDIKQGGVGVDLFNALVRQVNRIDDGYKR
ncbi:MAG: class II aldolase/adducin family protein [Alphaproteobacteria bacterium]|nr:class II aldolase/adducin family protein [Alphaproteobacteria bacterium]